LAWGHGGVLGIAAREFANEAVEAVESGTVRQKHEGALTGNDTDVTLAAELNRLRADGALSSRTMHPNARNASLGAVAHNLVRNLGRGHQERGLDGWLDILHASETAAFLEFRSVGIHGNHVIAAVREFLEHRDAETAGFAGDADQGDALLGEKVLDGFEG